MSTEPLSEREEILQKSIEIIQTIEETFVQIFDALQDIDNEAIRKNIEGEMGIISQQVILATRSDCQTVSAIAVNAITKTRELLEQTLENDGILGEHVNDFMTMRLEPLESMAEGLKNYALGEETTGCGEDGGTIRFVLRPSSIMKAKGSIKLLSERYPEKNSMIIKMAGAKVPKSMFIRNNFFINKGRSQAVLSKKHNQPRVDCHEDDEGDDRYIMSPEISIITAEELETVLNFFDDFLTLGIQKRITVSVPTI